VGDPLRTVAVAKGPLISLALSHFCGTVACSLDKNLRRILKARLMSYVDLLTPSTSSDCQLNFPKRHVLADSDIDHGVQRAIVVTRFAVLDFHRTLSGARQQSDEVDSVQCSTRLVARLNFTNATF